MFKRLVAVATATMLTIAMSVSAFAATGVSAKEQELINSLPADYQAKAESILKDVDLTDAEVAQVQQAVKDVKAGKTVEELKALGEAELTKMANEVLAKVDTIVKKYDIKVSAADIVKLAQAKTPAEINAVTVTVGNPTGTQTPTPAPTQNNNKNDGNLNTTPKGVDFSTTAAVVAGLGLSVAGIAVIAKKKDLVNA
ncbi:MAG: hypothetical protein HFH65_03425 [Lachnospiraceae bacterium]|nr:hypothetical protein [Lachnospiraceae bacterium]